MGVFDHAGSHASGALHEKSVVALSSLLAAVLLTGTKLSIGLWTNSLGILSEAAHSGLDLMAAAMTLWAVRVSGTPPDSKHTYGHGKFENLSALFETLLLLATCVWIVYEGVHRLFFTDQVHVEANVWAFGTVMLSIVVDVSRSRALSRVAHKYKSQALEADALHFSTDVWSSCVVLLGLIAVAAANQFGIPWLTKADAVAAMFVAAIVVMISFRLARKAVDELLDSVPLDLQQRVRDAGLVPGVLEVTRVRVRRSGPHHFADVTIRVGREIGLERAHAIADDAERAVRDVLPGADVVVHAEPAAAADEDLRTTVRVLAMRHGMEAHDIQVLAEAQARNLCLHLTVDGSLGLDEAHRLVSAFEAELHEALPGIGRIDSHIEPAGEQAAACQAGSMAVRSQIEETVADFLRRGGIRCAVHDLQVWLAGSAMNVSFHCVMDPDLPIADAHSFTEELERCLHARIPRLGSVVIHVEPHEDHDTQTH